MKSSSTLVFIIWVCAFGLESWLASEAIRASQCPGLPLPIPPIFYLAPIVLFGLASFFVRRSPFYNPSLARFVDAKYGPATLETFLVRLKPLLLFGLVSLLGGVVQTWVCYDSGNTLSQGMGSLSISAGFALLLAHAILRYRGVKGV
jgi:hypothetical protein